MNFLRQQQTPQSNVDFFSTLNANRVLADLLKTELAKATRTQVPTSFNSIFLEETNNLAQFVNQQQVQLEGSAKSVFGRAHGLASQSRLNASHNATLHDLQLSTQRLVDDCIALQDFYASNRTILFELAKQADQEITGNTVFTATLEIHPLLSRAHLNSSLVCVVSDLHHALRQAKDKILHGNDGGADLWQAPSSFQRNTTKYWVTNESLTKLMMICAAEAPLLVYGKKGPLTKPNSRTSEGDKLWDGLATKITSIYFDSTNMDLYRERLKRAEGAQLLRVRWYGTQMPKGTKPIFVELKTHHERWVAQKSVKERATILEQDMHAFLEPVKWELKDAEAMIKRAAKKELKPDELTKQTKLLWRMHNLVVNHKLTACVRSVYDRAAFQSAKSNDLRLTLDRNVTLVNERVPRSNPNSWCLSDQEAKVAESTVVPFNVFEVKLAGSDPMPNGLAAAMNDNTIQVATKFSKFLTGAAAFNTVQTLPYWAAHPAFYSFFGMDKRMKTTATAGHEATAMGDYQSMEEHAASLQIGGVAIAPPNPSRIEPKTFFANERTFVQWINASTLLISIAGFLVTSEVGSYNATAAVISLAAMMLVVYSTALYFKRLNLLKHREPYGYFNKVNPIFLTSVVGITVFLIWADSIKGSDFLAFFSEDYDRRGLLTSTRLLRGGVMYKPPCDGVVSTSLDFLSSPPSNFLVDAQRDSILVTSGDSIYRQSQKDGGPQELLLSIRNANLRDLTYVGNRLFILSNDAHDAELMEIAWWSPRGGDEERIRIVGRWALGTPESSQVHGLTFVPSNDSETDGHLYVLDNSSIHTYSVPDEDTPELVRLNSLNMKVLNQGDGDASFQSMFTFKGISYFLKPDSDVLEAWNLTKGSLEAAIKLPVVANMEWTSFGLTRKAEGDVFLHMLSDDSRLWSFQASESSSIVDHRFTLSACSTALN